MSIPSLNDLCSTLFNAIKKGDIKNFIEYKHKILQIIQKEYSLTNETMEQVDLSDRNLVRYRADWAKTWLKRLDIINEERIDGQKVYFLTTNGNNIKEDNLVLFFNKSIKTYLKNKNKNNNEELYKENKINNTIANIAVEIPTEQMNFLAEDYYNQIKIELYKRMMELDPFQFEKVIKKLLISMGYKNVTNTQRTRDGGIDGMINSDILGFNDIYYQVKRYKEDSPITLSQINEFIGAIDKKTNHGLFFTTSYFTSDAMKKAKDTSKNIRLFEKKELLDLMMKFNIGVKEYKINYPIREINEDFFSDIDN